ncbi:signal peptidase I [Ruania alba]|uniref:signal peptidase I n=1 Tax=Ruania alba TaxID=648782 RepID=UPI001587B8AC|nr:signal peptidase I [Ruania alba]
MALVLSIALALGVVALATFALVIPRLGGGVPLTVLTNSMSPAAPPGTLIVVFPVDVDEIAVGDVITYQIRSGEPEVITHRVVGVASPDEDGPRFITQGDNNADPDPDPVRSVQVQGRVAYSIPYLGWVNNVVNGEHRGWIVGIGAGGLFAYALWNIIAGIAEARRSRRRRALESADEDGDVDFPK